MCDIEKCRFNAATVGLVQQAVWRKGGSSPAEIFVVIERLSSATKVVEAPPAPSRRPATL